MNEEKKILRRSTRIVILILIKIMMIIHRLRLLTYIPDSSLTKHISDVFECSNSSTCSFTYLPKEFVPSYHFPRSTFFKLCACFQNGVLVYFVHQKTTLIAIIRPGSCEKWSFFSTVEEEMGKSDVVSDVLGLYCQNSTDQVSEIEEAVEFRHPSVPLLTAPSLTPPPLPLSRA